MRTRYVERSDREVRHILESQMGFTEVDYTDERYSKTFERVYKRDVTTASGKEYPYYILVYTTVDRNTNKTRDVGSDAIRFVLMSKTSGYPVKRAEKRVFRTKSALVNIVNRAREVFRYVMDSENHCPKCNALMDIREVKNGSNKGNKFLGCTNYPTCNGTKRLD